MASGSIIADADVGGVCFSASCGGGVCSISNTFARRSPDFDGLIGDKSPVNATIEPQHNSLTKRVFRYSTSSNDYAGDRKPTVGEVAAYLPDVFTGGEDQYFGARLQLVTTGASKLNHLSVSVVYLRYLVLPKSHYCGRVC